MQKLEAEDSEVEESVDKVEFDGDSKQDDDISGYWEEEVYYETYHGTILDKCFYCKNDSDGTDFVSEKNMKNWMVPQ